MTEPIDISIDYLIKEGILTPDDENYLYDPRNRNILNCYMIHVELDGEEYIATLGDKEELSDGSCDENKININELTILCDNKRCSSNWYNKDLKLSLSGINEEDILASEVEWINLNGVNIKQEAYTKKEINVNPDSILNTTYTVSVKYEGKENTVSKEIKIDKEKPVITSKNLKVVYDKTEYLEVFATDMSGAGVKGYALSEDTCNNVSFKLTGVEVAKSGIYKLCVSDIAGNIYEENIQINKVTFDYNDPTNMKKDIFFLTGDTNYPLLVPSRAGYNFAHWEKDSTRITGFDSINNNDVLKASWNIRDVEIPYQKIDKNTGEITIDNKYNIIFLLNNSAEMQNALSSVNNALQNFARSIPFENSSTATVITFNNDASVKLNSSTSRTQTLEAVKLSASGGLSFNSAFSSLKKLMENTDLNKSNTFVILLSNSAVNDYSETDLTYIKEHVNTFYSIGLLRGYETIFNEISSSNSYYEGGSDYHLLTDIFNKIDKDIKKKSVVKLDPGVISEELRVLSNNGLISLENMYITENTPFILKINGKDYIYHSNTDISNITTVVSGIYYLDLKKIDNVYKLNGDFKNVKFVYYIS